jgi:hypothetical protein
VFRGRDERRDPRIAAAALDGLEVDPEISSVCRYFSF